MKTKAVWYFLIAVVVLFVVLTFLNCGRADATPRERARKNRIADTVFVVHSHQQARGGESGCKQMSAQYKFENYIGNQLFTETLYGRWCFDGKHVTSVDWPGAPGEIHIGSYPWNSWRFEFWHEPVETGHVGGRYVFIRIKATFEINVLWYRHQVTPYVQCTLRGDGSYRCGKGA